MIALRTTLVLILALAVQVSFVAHFSLDGARGDVLLLVALAAAVAGGPDKGAAVGFAAGLAMDLVVDTPLGLSVLVYCVVGYLVGSFQGSVLRVTWWMPSVSVAAGSAVAVIVYALFGAVLGQPTLEGPPLPTIVLVVAGLNGLLAPLATWSMRWALTDTSQRSFSPR